MHQARHPGLRGVKTSLFLLAVLCVSTVFVASQSRFAHAESFLYGVTCSVKGLFGRDCQPRRTPSPSPEETPPAGGGTTSGGKTSPSSGSGEPKSGHANPSGSGIQVTPPPPIELEDALLDELPTVARVSEAASRHTFPAHVAPIIQQPGGEVLGQTAAAPIEASEQGWKIMGVPWVWWALLGAVLVGGAFAVGRYVNFRRISGVAK